MIEMSRCVQRAFSNHENKYKDLIEHLDSYVLSCQLADLDMSYSLNIASFYSDDLFNIMICDKKSKYGDDKTGFLIRMNTSNDYVLIEIDILIDSGFNPYSIAHALKKRGLTWKKDIINHTYHNYEVKMKIDEFPLFLEVFQNHL